MIAKVPREDGLRALAGHHRASVPGKEAPAVRAVAEVERKSEDLHIETSGRLEVADSEHVPAIDYARHTSSTNVIS
jgi:hypothetical protein